MFRALRDLETEQALSLRVCCNVAAHHLEQAAVLGLSTGVGSERLRLGHVKVFSDGTLGSRTARMLEPMVGEEQCGLYLTPPEEMGEVFRRAAELDFAVSVHSIGDDFQRQGVLLAFGSDAPVSSADPRYGLQCAVHRALAGQTPWYPSQTLTFDEAMTAYTRGPALATGWSTELGSLRPGSLADLVVWSKDFESSKNYLEHSVWLTVSGGRIVHEASET